MFFHLEWLWEDFYKLLLFCKARVGDCCFIHLHFPIFLVLYQRKLNYLLKGIPIVNIFLWMLGNIPIYLEKTISTKLNTVHLIRVCYLGKPSQKTVKIVQKFSTSSLSAIIKHHKKILWQTKVYLLLYYHSFYKFLTE